MANVDSRQPSTARTCDVFCIRGSQQSSNCKPSPDSAVVTDLFGLTHSWPFPGATHTMSIRELYEYIAISLPAGDRIISLVRRKELRGVRHEYILLEICRENDGLVIWLRLNRAPRLDFRTMMSSSSVFAADDSATISRSDIPLLCGTRSHIVARVIFRDGPTLRDLGRILRALHEESRWYRLYRENCYWFCSVIQQFLTDLYAGVLQDGALSHAALGISVRKRIAVRLVHAT